MPVLRSRDQIDSDVDRIAESLRAMSHGRVPVFIAILKGSFVFLADLVRAYGEPHEIEFLSLTRVDPTQKDSSAVRVLHDLGTNIRGRLVVVVEGIRSRGTKIEYVDRFLRLHEPEEVIYAALIRQKGSTAGAIPLHAWGFEIDREYGIGYGLDLGERYRNLPFIGFVDPESPAGASLQRKERT